MALNFQDVFAVLKPDLSVDLVPVTPTIFKDLDVRYDKFKSHTLVSIYNFESDWKVWERHPAGDEIVVLLSGSVKMTILKEEGEQIVSLTEPGSFVVIPCNAWHTAGTSEPTQMLFITPGEGTENHKDPKADS